MKSWGSVQKFKNLGGLMALALMSACGVKTKCDNGFNSTMGGDALTWNDGSNVSFAIHSSMPVEFQDALVAAGDRYVDEFAKTKVTVRQSSSVPAFRGNESDNADDGINGVYWVTEDQWNFKDAAENALAVTITHFSNKGMKEADVYYRASRFAAAGFGSTSPVKKSEYAPLQFARIDQTLFKGAEKALQSLGLRPSNQQLSAYSTFNASNFEHEFYMASVHELGHALGRCHASSTDSIMYFEVSAATSQKRQQPFSDYDRDVMSKHYELK